MNCDEMKFHADLGYSRADYSRADQYYSEVLKICQASSKKTSNPGPLVRETCEARIRCLIHLESDVDLAFHLAKDLVRTYLVSAFLTFSKPSHF